MLFFDLDGVLLDSNDIWIDVDTIFLQHHNLTYTPEYYQGVAHTTFPLAAKFTKAYGNLNISEEEIMQEWIDLAGDRYATTIPLKPNVLETLTKLKKNFRRMAVLTSALPQHCSDALEHHDIRRFFDHIYYAQDYHTEKRDPELFRIIAKEENLDPSSCILLDDSPRSCETARQAGWKTVGVYDVHFGYAEAEMRHSCDWYIHSLNEIVPLSKQWLSLEKCETQEY